jgi:prolyl-tRNA synthetase
MARSSVLASQAEDFPRWYQDVVAKAALADNGPVRGTMVILPYGFSIWERMQHELDTRIKGVGAENLLLPSCSSRRATSTVRRALSKASRPRSPWSPHAGGKELEEPVVVRPTSETIINTTSRSGCRATATCRSR